MILDRTDNRILSSGSPPSKTAPIPAQSTFQAKVQPSLQIGGVGGLVAVSVDGDFYFPGYDNNGNVVGYWDESGSIVAEYAYDAFGNTISETGTMASVFPHRFSTKYYDAETDLYYYGYRYYSPSLGRWISRDPIGEEGGNNLLAFLQNSPTSTIDNLGCNRFITGGLVPQKYDQNGTEMLRRYGCENDGRRIIRLLALLNRRTYKGRKCFNARIEDFVSATPSMIAAEVSKHPDDVYIIAHGGLNVTGAPYEYTSYYWKKGDVVVEGFSKYSNTPIIPLNQLGPLNPLNLFGCFISPEHRKQPREWAPRSARFSDVDSYIKIGKALFNRLKEQYTVVSSCDCPKDIVIYEGEIGGNGSGTSTQAALKFYPIDSVPYD